MIAAAAGVAACGSDMPAAGTSETTAIHIEVLRHFLTSLREGTGPVFIMERIDAAAADSMLHSAGTDVIPAAERDAITTALQDIAGVRFIAAMEETWIDQDSCPLVSGGGTVITLGPVTPAKRLVPRNHECFQDVPRRPLADLLRCAIWRRLEGDRNGRPGVDRRAVNHIEFASG